MSQLLAKRSGRNTWWPTPFGRVGGGPDRISRGRDRACCRHQTSTWFVRSQFMLYSLEPAGDHSESGSWPSPL